MESRAIIQILFVVIATIHLPVSVFLIYILRTTRHMPFASNYLATGLITFDVIYITCSAFHKFITEPMISVLVNHLGSTLVQLTYTTTALMSLERMLVLAFPMRYLRLGSEKRIRFIINVVWLTVIFLFSFVSYIGCWIINRDMDVFHKPEICRQLRLNYYVSLMAVNQTIIFVSYSVVLRIVKKQTLRDNMKLSITSLRKLLRMYKSTFMVMKYIIVMTATSVGYVVIQVLIRMSIVKAGSGRLGIDTITILNCFLDPFLYVFWNTECREKCKQLMSKLMCRNETGTENETRRYRPGSMAIIDIIYKQQQQQLQQQEIHHHKQQQQQQHQQQQQPEDHHH